MAGNDGQRMVFAHQLRAVAALSVMLAHLAGLHFVLPATSAAILKVAPVDPGPVPWFAQLFFAVPAFSFGPFGVGLFFLISGFVIPFALERQHPLPFLVARAFRLWPTYAAGLALGIAALALLHGWLGTAFPHSAGLVAANAVLVVRDWLHLPQIDFVVWTLEIEIKFYLVMAVAAAVGGGVRLGTVLVLAGLFSAFAIGVEWFRQDLIAANVTLFRTLHVPAFACGYLSVMLVGVLFKLRLDGRITQRQALVAGAVIAFVLVPAQFVLGVAGDKTARATLPSYAVALVVFAVAFALRDRVRDNRLLDWFATRSYPLYVVHPLVGYGLLHAMAVAGISAGTRIIVALAVVLVLADLLHRLVEEPTRRAGRDMARRLEPERRPTP